MFRRSVVMRLIMPLALMILLVVAVIVLAERARTHIDGAHAVVEREQRVTLELAELRSLSRSLQRDALNLVTEHDPAARAEIGRRFDRRHLDFARRLAALAAAPGDDAPPRYGATQREVLAELAAVRRLATTDREQALGLFRAKVRPAERAASEIADALIERHLAEGESLAAQAARTSRRLGWQLPLLAACLSILAIAGAVAIILKTVLRPLTDIAEAMQRLAGGDASRDVPHADRPDAIGAMARAIEIFRAAARERDALRTASDDARAADAARLHADAALRERLRAEDEQRAALEAQRRALLGTLAGAVDASLQAVNDKLRASAGRLSRSADDVARHAAVAGREAEVTAAAAEGATTELAAVAATSSQLAHSVSGLNDRARTAAQAVQHAAGRSRSAAARVAQLGDWADRVGEMTGLIGGIARQSRLLAVNATIEASRAGDGRSFAVVAAEMKILAGQTAAATDRVEGQVAAIRAVAAEAVAALAEIDAAIVQIEQDAGFVADAVAEQGAAGDAIGDGMRLALVNVDQVGLRMTALGRTAGSTGALAGALRADADLLAADAAEVDLALRDLVTRLREAA